MNTQRIFICLLLLPFLSQGQIFNKGFENWPAELEHSSYEDDLLAVGVKNPMKAIPTDWDNKHSLFGICRVEHPCAGEYALLLFSWYNGEEAFLQQTFPLDTRPESIKGCYSYLYHDTAYVEAEKYMEVVLWKDNDIIGTTHFDFDTSSVFTSFEVPLVYSSPSTPDSMSILFYTDVFPSNTYPVDGLLYLDELSIQDPITQSYSIVEENDFVVYPNPFQNSFYIDCKKKGQFHYELYNLKGQLLDKNDLPDASNNLEIHHLSAGVYILNIIGENNQKLVQKFIKN